VSRTWVTIVLAGAGTFAMRASFLAYASRLATVPPWAARVLRQIPPAALAAIVVPGLLRPDGELAIVQPHLGAGLLAAVVAWRTRNVAVTLIVGMIALVALQAW
jgi:branched-subunit amino acid transport protein